MASSSAITTTTPYAPPHRFNLADFSSTLLKFPGVLVPPAHGSGDSKVIITPSLKNPKSTNERICVRVPGDVTFTKGLFHVQPDAANIRTLAMSPVSAQLQQFMTEMREYYIATILATTSVYPAAIPEKYRGKNADTLRAEFAPLFKSNEGTEKDSVKFFKVHQFTPSRWGTTFFGPNMGQQIPAHELFDRTFVGRVTITPLRCVLGDSLSAMFVMDSVQVLSLPPRTPTLLPPSTQHATPSSSESTQPVC
jgi:hypothetical protein